MMMMVNLTATAIVTMMATALAIIYYHLFYDSHDDSGEYIYIYILINENGERVC